MTTFRVRAFAPAVAALLALSGCAPSASVPPATTSSPSSASPAAVVRIVALGDSDTTGIGDSSGRGWVGRFGDLLHSTLRTVVHVENLASEGKSSDDLRGEVTSDAGVRSALARADVVLVGIGGADLNPGDDALDAKQCRGRACYAPLLQRFGRNIHAIAAEVRKVAPPSSLLRAISLPNVYPGAGDAIPPSATAAISRYQVLTERTAVCDAMRSNGGLCIDVVRAFNGPSATGDAYASGLLTKDPCCYPSGQGQQRIAELLLRAGVAGLPGSS